ncbi:MAG: peptide deformylase [bacterium]|nr:peptide deformylase [bacterium]
MATILQLTLNPEPILRKRLAELSLMDIASPAIQTLIEDMRVTMVAAQGIGLAGNQVGKDLQIFTIDRQLAREAKISDVFINPVIEDLSQKLAVMEEGCLSVPGKFADVRRPAQITVSALDGQGEPFRIEAKGLLARVLQHEIDHLNGKLFIDRL